MRIIIVGGGKLAYYLVKTLLPSRHDITIIEQRKDVCEKVATDFEDVKVYNGDGTNIEILEKARCDRADFLVAVTGKDENNLIACEIAKKRFKVAQTVAKVNNPKNIEMFHRLGVDKPVSSTQILANVIEQEIDYMGMRIAFKVENSTKSIVEFDLSPKSSAVNKTLKEYNFPGDSKLVLITRKDGSILMPQGDIFMKAEDNILMVCDEKHYDTIWRIMVKR